MIVAYDAALHKAKRQFQNIVASVELAIEEGIRIDLFERNSMSQLYGRFAT